MTAVTVTPAMRRKAEALAELVPVLPRGRDKQTGIRYVTIPSSDDPIRKGHNTNGLGCTCDGHRRRGVCTHQLAVAAYQQRQEAARIAAAQPVRKSAQQLYAEAGPYGPCISKQGCTEPAGGKSRLCGTHLDALLDQLGA
jgi:hypothetical protein